MRRCERIAWGTRYARTRLVLLLALLFHSVTASAEEIGDDSLISRHFDAISSSIEDLELQLSDLEDDVSDLEHLVGDETIVHSGAPRTSMEVFGRLHVDYIGFPNNDAQIDVLEGGPEGPQDQLGFRRMRIGVRGVLPGNMTYCVESELAFDDIDFRDAWLGWHKLPYIQSVRIGNQKRPYGLDHINDSNFAIFMERPMVVEAFNEDNRRLGIQTLGATPDLTWNWRLGIFNQRLLRNRADYRSDHLQPEIAGRIANTIWYDETSGGRGYAHWAVSASSASPDGSVDGDNGGTGPDQNEARFRTHPELQSFTRWLDTGRIARANNYQLLGWETVINVGAVQLGGEYQNVWLDRDQGFGRDLHFHGGYVYASYFLTGEHLPWDRTRGSLGRVMPLEEFFFVHRCAGGSGAGWGAWQLAARYSYADLEDADVLGGEGESLTLGLNWYWTSNARLQLNYVWGEIENNAVTRGIPLSGDYEIFGVRAMVDY